MRDPGSFGSASSRRYRFPTSREAGYPRLSKQITYSPAREPSLDLELLPTDTGGFVPVDFCGVDFVCRSVADERETLEFPPVPDSVGTAEPWKISDCATDRDPFGVRDPTDDVEVERRFAVFGLFITQNSIASFECQSLSPKPTTCLIDNLSRGSAAEGHGNRRERPSPNLRPLASRECDLRSRPEPSYRRGEKELKRRFGGVDGVLCFLIAGRAAQLARQEGRRSRVILTARSTSRSSSGLKAPILARKRDLSTDRI